MIRPAPDDRICGRSAADRNRLQFLRSRARGADAGILQPNPQTIDRGGGSWPTSRPSDLSHIKAAAPIFVPCPTMRFAAAAPRQSDEKQGELTVRACRWSSTMISPSAIRSEFSLQISEVRSYATAAEMLSASDLDCCDCFVIDQKMPA